MLTVFGWCMHCNSFARLGKTVAVDVLPECGAGQCWRQKQKKLQSVKRFAAYLSMFASVNNHWCRGPESNRHAVSSAGF
jgi:hypothetical protein